MAKSDITGKRKLKAQHVSHSNIKTKRWRNVNIQTRRVWVPDLGRFVTLKLTTRDIRTIVLRRVVWLVGLGIVVGIVLSLWAGQFIQTQLFELQPRDPMTLVAAAAVFLAIGLLAGWLPARRAARIDPVIVLRG